MINIKEMIKNEKGNLNPIRRIMDYIIVPIYLGTMILLITISIILMSIDETKYTSLLIVFILIFGIVSAALLISVPFVRKKEIALELSKCNLDDPYSSDKEQDELYALDGIQDKSEPVIFNEKGISLTNDEFYSYDCFEILMVTNNAYKKINLRMEFRLTESEDEFDPYILFSLDNKMLHIIKKYNLIIKNQNVLDYLLSNKKDAFLQIYNFGYIRKIKK